MLPESSFPAKLRLAVVVTVAAAAAHGAKYRCPAIPFHPLGSRELPSPT